MQVSKMMGRNTATHTTIAKQYQKILSMCRGSTRQVLRMCRALRHGLMCITCATQLAMMYILTKLPSYAVNYVQPGLNYIQTHYGHGTVISMWHDQCTHGSTVCTESKLHTTPHNTIVNIYSFRLTVSQCTLIHSVIIYRYMSMNLNQQTSQLRSADALLKTMNNIKYSRDHEYYRMWWHIFKSGMLCTVQY